MTVKRTFTNVCSISDRHVLELLPLFDLETGDPLFDGELSSWRPTIVGSKYWTGDWSSQPQTNKRRRLLPSKPLTAIERAGS
jgi:hypothetical protein